LKKKNNNSVTATCTCMGPETRISFLVARWRPTQACCGCCWCCSV